MTKVSLDIEVRRAYPRLEWRISVGVILLLDAGVILEARIYLKSRKKWHVLDEPPTTAPQRIEISIVGTLSNSVKELDRIQRPRRHSSTRIRG